MSVLAQSVGILWRVIESYGMDPAPFFAEAGLTLSWPIEPGTRLPYEELDEVRARAAEASGDPAFGLRTASNLHPSYLGALGYAILASDTLRTAFDRIHRYVRVLNDQGHFDLDEVEGGVRATLRVDQGSLNAAVRDDGQLATLVGLCRINAGKDFKPVAVSLCRAEPGDRSAWDDFFQCPLEFGAEANSVTVSTQDLDEPLPSANPILAQMNERIVVQRLAKLDRDNVTGRVRGAIMEQLPSGDVSDESVADALHITPRTMHRRLKEDGETFRTVLKSVRQDLAEQYLADPTLTLTEITFLLGFSEMSSFSRAYKHWHGQSPSEARRND
ncbi:MAG: AraC family transcriptional regulator [Xanthomonadales bacterium]|jgi:AraC-like DNA-binding protein|nr:AraC family transcriptional regulator [Xanthomonadales bacterium]